MSDDVPDELLREILSRLPVASLLRFRCVSKLWKSLIDDDQFSIHHLNHSKKTNSNLNILISGCNLHSTSFHSTSFDLLNETNRATFQQLSHPLKFPKFGAEIVGSCDGLLLLSNSEEDEEEEKVNMVWNPSIRRFHKLPFTTGIEFPDYFIGCRYTVYGFGYDFVSDDYKIVRIIQFNGNGSDDFDSEVKVYTLKSDSWKRISDFPYFLKYKCCNGVLSNGALHWVVSRKVVSYTDSLVAAFDLATEEYRLVPLPQFTGDEFRMSVVVFGGCLGLMCKYYMNHVDFWVMKEYGVQESWSILFTIKQSEVCCFKEFDYLTLIVYSKCGKKVLLGLDWYGLMWYDLDDESIDLPTMQMPSDEFFEFHTCLQSLLLLKNGTSDSDILTN